MRRTQLYLDDDLWQALHIQARSQRTTISDLVRQAARERYLGTLDQRRAAMQGFVGIRKERSDVPDATAYVRSLRRGNCLAGLAKA